MNPSGMPLRVRALCLGVLAALVAQILFLTPPDAAAQLSALFWDKLLHFLVFGAMAVLLWIGAGGRSPLAVWLLIVAVGGMDEARQAFTDGRMASLADLFADAAGSGLAVLLLNALAKIPGETVCAES